MGASEQAQPTGAVSALAQHSLPIVPALRGVRTIPSPSGTPRA